MMTYSPGAEFKVVNSASAFDEDFFLLRYKVSDSVLVGKQIYINPVATGRVIYSAEGNSKYGNSIVLEHASPNGEIFHSAYTNLPIKPNITLGEFIPFGGVVYDFTLTAEIKKLNNHLTFMLFRRCAQGKPFSNKCESINPEDAYMLELGYPDKVLNNWLTIIANDKINTALPIITDNTINPTKFQKPEDLIEEGNFYLVGQGAWHGGIHITDRQYQEGNVLHPVLCIADGVIVAYRMMSDYKETEFDGETFKFSNNFCLVRHAINKDNYVYSLYMHLCPVSYMRKMSSLHKPTWLYSKVAATIKCDVVGYSDPVKIGRSGYHITGGFSCELKAGTKVFFDIHDIERQEFNEKVVWAVRANIGSGVRFRHINRWAWIHINDEIISVNEVMPTTHVDIVYEPINPIPIRAGDAIGFLGLHQHPGVKSTEAINQYRIHLELFSDDSGLIDQLRQQENWKFVDDAEYGSLVQSTKSLEFCKKIKFLLDDKPLPNDYNFSLLEEDLYNAQKNGLVYSMAVRNKSEWHLSNALSIVDDIAAVKNKPQQIKYLEHEKERMHHLCWMNLLRNISVNHSQLWHFHPFSLYVGSMGDAQNVISIYERIKHGHSIKGYVRELRYTHNTSLNGLMGILASNTMIARVEPNVNFRYGIDSRYAGGVTLVMSPTIKKLKHQFYDLYKQRHYLLGIGQDHTSVTTNKLSQQSIDELLSYVHYVTDFRKNQLSNIVGKELIPINKVDLMRDKKHRRDEYKLRYSLSLVNPQIRISWSEVHIAALDHLELVIIAESLHKEILSKGMSKKLKAGFSSFARLLLSKNSSAKRTVDVATSLSKEKAPKLALDMYEELMRQGKIKVIPDSNIELYSHEAGRIEERGKADEERLSSAARLGMDISHEYFHEKMNNSPAAYSLPMLTEVEKVYFKHLLDRGCFMEHPITRP